MSVNIEPIQEDPSQLVKDDYEALLREAIGKIRNTWNHKLRKELQIELSWISNEIEKYGFDFHPEHYLREKMDELEKFVDSIK